MSKVATGRVALIILSLATALVIALCLWSYVQLRSSLPRLQGNLKVSGLSASVTISRDAQGVPTLVGRTRSDLVFALGYLHGQERFFQMDAQRRSAAGELSDIVGSVALNLDRSSRVHRFRSRATALVAAMPPAERAMLEAYSVGVNTGLSDLASAPFEYLLLRSAPVPWTAEDTVLTAFSMYLTLQQPQGASERLRGAVVESLGQEFADFLLPEGTSWDVPLDGSSLPPVELPSRAVKRAAAPHGEGREIFVEPLQLGSNAFAVTGMLASGRGAMVANDMHLGLRAPNIWYRVRLIIDGSDEPALKITGITLPGAPSIVAGSNGRVAWGFTNSYIDTSDVVVLEPTDSARPLPHARGREGAHPC